MRHALARSLSFAHIYKQQNPPLLPVDTWCCQQMQMQLRACLPSKKMYFLTPSSGGILDTAEANVSKPACYVGRCNEEDLQLEV